MKGKVLKYLNHHYIWAFLKQKIKSALVSKEFMENLIDSCICNAFISSSNDVREIHIVLF